MAEHKSYREQSKRNWGTTDAGDLNLDQIQTGCLLRIADASEVMAKNHQELIDERDKYKRLYEAEHTNAARLQRSVAALKGVITKLRKGRK